jgi:hypothetical protein
MIRQDSSWRVPYEANEVPSSIRRNHVNSKEITDLIIAFQAVITLFISMRAFSLYFKTRSDILFIVGLSMAVIVLGGIAGLIGDFLITSGAFNTFWFRYIGQIVSYLFVFLSRCPAQNAMCVL